MMQMLFLFPFHGLRTSRGGQGEKHCGSCGRGFPQSFSFFYFSPIGCHLSLSLLLPMLFPLRFHCHPSTSPFLTSLSFFCCCFFEVGFSNPFHLPPPSRQFYCSRDIQSAPRLMKRFPPHAGGSVFFDSRCVFHLVFLPLGSTFLRFHEARPRAPALLLACVKESSPPPSLNNVSVVISFFLKHLFPFAASCSLPKRPQPSPLHNLPLLLPPSRKLPPQFPFCAFSTSQFFVARVLLLVF